MYAFNRRFVPTRVFYGLTVPTLLAALAGILMLVFTVGMIMKGTAIIAPLFFIISVAAFVYAYKSHTGVAKQRIFFLSMTGKKDRTAKTLELK